MAVGIVGLLTLFPLGLDATARAGDRTTAAILGEYIIEQVRLHQDDIATNDTTSDALDNDVLNWVDYDDNEGNELTFEVHDPDKPYELETHGYDGYGSGEQIVKQLEDPDNPYDPLNPDDTNNGLSGSDLFSRYEVGLRFDEIEDNDAFSTGLGHTLMQVTITVRWPRAYDDESRKNQETMTFVTYIRPGS